MNQTVIPQRIDYADGQVVLSKYKIVKALGDGAFGQVYKVTELQTNQTYALKLLRLWDVPSEIRQPLIDRFDMEFKTGLIQSKYLVHSYDYGLLEGNPYIVMEFCSGGDLSSKVGKKDIDISKVSSEILGGLNDLHSNGKVHRDLKPENVLFKADGTAVLADFGICGDRNKRMTERNIFGKPYQIFGTYAYMPPEQVNRARGEATVLPTTDVFSFGVMLYQLLTGKLPFGPLEDQNDLVRYQKRGKAGEWDRSALMNVENGRTWEVIIEGCLQPNFKERFQNANTVLRMLPQPSLHHTAMLMNPAPAAPSAPVYREPQPAAPSASGNLVLKIMHGEEYGKVYNLTQMALSTGRKLFTMGRTSQNDIHITETQSSYISRFHCVLETDANFRDWRIVDGQWRPDERQWVRSTNGTYVNSSEVTEKGFWMQVGDIISIGDTKLKLEQQ